MDGDQIRRRLYYRHLEKIVKASQSLLNLGSGTSFVFEELCHQWNPALQIVSADLSKPLFKPDYVNAFHSVNVSHSLSLPYKNFDLVTAFEVIEHVDRTDELIRNASNHCRPGGIIAVSFPNLASIFCRFELLLGYQPHILEVSHE